MKEIIISIRFDSLMASESGKSFRETGIGFRLSVDKIKSLKGRLVEITDISPSRYGCLDLRLIDDEEF